MKSIYKLLLSIISLLLLTGCEDIVDIDLKTADPKLVIDASITHDLPCMVILTKSQAFHNNDKYQSVSGASIELIDDAGNREVLTERADAPGVYISSANGMVDRKYNLKVSVEGETYQASATIPQAIPIDSLYIFSLEVADEKWYSPAVIYNDPANVKNYYYSTITMNNKLLRNIFFKDDEFDDGLKEIHDILFYDSDEYDTEDMEIGDLITVEMQSVDEGTYMYYKSRFSVAAGGAVNPLTNFSGNVLGFFKAYNSSIKTITIDEKHIFTRK